MGFITFIHSSGVAQADLRSLHAHHLLQRVPWKPQGAGQTNQRWRAVPHRAPQPCKLPAILFPMVIMQDIRVCVLVAIRTSFWNPDQHFHDPPLQLRQRPAGPVHVQEPGEVHPDLDQPEVADATTGAASTEILPDLS